jgi:hypothetical protein
MYRTQRALAALALGLALVGATTAVAAADPATGTQQQTDQRKALYQSELEQNLATARAAGAVAGQPAAAADPAAPGPGRPPSEPLVFRRYLLNPAVNPLRSWRRPMT